MTLERTRPTSAVHADPIEAVETPFARARAHAAKVEDILASIEKSAPSVIRDAFAEALRRDPKKTRRWVWYFNGTTRAACESCTKAVTDR